MSNQSINNFSPGKPEVTDVDSDSVSLSWSRPLKDGGNKITGYVIEGKRPGERNWKPMGDSKDTKTTLTGLKDGDEFEFRIRAKNQAGPGEPSEPTDVVKVCPKASKYQVSALSQ